AAARRRAADRRPRHLRDDRQSHPRRLGRAAAVVPLADRHRPGTLPGARDARPGSGRGSVERRQRRDLPAEAARRPMMRRAAFVVSLLLLAACSREKPFDDFVAECTKELMPKQVQLQKNTAGDHFYWSQADGKLMFWSAGKPTWVADF